MSLPGCYSSKKQGMCDFISQRHCYPILLWGRQLRMRGKAIFVRVIFEPRRPHIYNRFDNRSTSNFRTGTSIKQRKVKLDISSCFVLEAVAFFRCSHVGYCTMTVRPVGTMAYKHNAMSDRKQHQLYSAINFYSS